SPNFDRRHFESALARLLVPDVAPLAKHESQLEPLARLALEQVGVLEQTTPPAQPTPAVPVYLRLSHPFLEDYVQRQVHQKYPVKDCILGATVVGTADVTGQTHLILEPSSSEAVAHIAFTGTTVSHTTGYSGPAILHTLGNTVFQATKRIVLSESAL